ncbi:asparagine synthase (glutamine-hydrolyzing) [Pseudomonas sp. HR96]|uniref:asparagine synthase (glutamine-hydrolyzing) n=1 Tax=Pseudomonas sp. HR96 TaxID=1027966 RepID=UPI002A763F6E|nr:asparagine synthase (glutamine-hydrolyzing) [Pseudomonas sp. HR96]WPO98863.1 asparagine synthase (glutamine-hydrolyzing) [Pseudomonas sp. HR96]
MCGLAGFSRQSGQDLNAIAMRMGDAISHRGPDSVGVWHDPGVPVVFCHRRLAILDLSPAGQQPMTSACGRYTVAYNGEIYNHLQLRKMLGAQGIAPQWRGHSDTETLLACISAWGLIKTLQSLVGMFAIALWDRQLHELVLARDRVGEKPLYWGWAGDVLLFASELKALEAHPAFEPTIDRNALTLLLRHSYIAAPYSIYEGIAKLMPGHILSLPLGSGTTAAKMAVSQPYWSMNDVVANGLASPFSGSPAEAVDALERQLGQSISDQMLSDVPLGAFLSGGVDSSTVVALMQARSAKPVRTFTIGFDEPAYDESPHAAAVASHLKTDHTELIVRAQDALAVIPNLPSIYSEPFADSSQIPTYLVSQMARQQVTVALSGDGGDELFGGYNRYLAVDQIWDPVQRMPMALRSLLAGGLRSLSPARWNQLFDKLRPVLPRSLQLSMAGEKARKLADVLSLRDGKDFYRQLTSHWADPESVVLGAREPRTLATDPSRWPATDCLQHAMMAMDAQTYMVDDILVKVDRAAMANSLETRVPMLDHRVVELAWSMPISYKIREGQGKWLLRQVLYRHVPRELIERPKTGFGIPLDSWLRGPLRDWAETLLAETRLRNEGYFCAKQVRAMWNEHLGGKKNWQYHLWNILMFQAWLEQR